MGACPVFPPTRDATEIYWYECRAEIWKPTVNCWFTATQFFSCKRRMLKAYRTHKISGTKALYITLFLLFFVYNKTEENPWDLEKWVANHFVCSKCIYLTGQQLKMICFWNVILESSDNSWFSWTPAVFFSSSLQFLFGIHTIQRQVYVFPLFSNLSRANALITETMDSKIRLIVSWREMQGGEYRRCVCSNTRGETVRTDPAAR